MPKAGANGTPGARKYRNVTMDAEVHDALVEMQTKLRRQWGFRPSLSQVVKHLIHSSAGSVDTPERLARRMSATFDDGPTAA